MKVENKNYYSDIQSLLDAMDTLVIETDTVLDIGCGIVPMNYFRPKLHIMVEPWDEYANILRQLHADDKSVLILKLDALEALTALQDKSVDSIFLLDVIEHLEKEAGIKIVAEIERVARLQAVIFTPLGFMPQHLEVGESDAWGLSGGNMQEHKSGWLPDDFGKQWEFHICEKYHLKDFRGEFLDKPFGAFFAVRKFQETQFVSLMEIPDIRRPLPSEIALQKLQVRMAELTESNRVLKEEISVFSARVSSLTVENSDLIVENADLKIKSAAVLSELNDIKRSRAFKLVNVMRRLLPLRRR